MRQYAVPVEHVMADIRASSIVCLLGPRRVAHDVPGGCASVALTGQATWRVQP